MSGKVEHPWDLTPKAAIALQQSLRQSIELKPLTGPVNTIAGADISYNKFSDIIYAGVVVLHFETMRPLLHSTVISRMRFPYIPGLLSFRETPALLQAWEGLPQKPDVVMLDGHGIAHPRRLGIAAHFGLLSACPSIGCAKKHLAGQYTEPAAQRGSFSPVLDDGETIGFVLRTKDRIKPVWVSPGHLITFEESLQITLHCARGYRIPEPTRQAHLLVNQLRRGEIKPGVGGQILR